MDLELRGRLAAVAGASAGLGYSCAKVLISEGATVAICGRDKARIESAASSLGPQAVPLVVDLSTAAGGREFIARSRQALGGPPNILVLNNGGPPPGTFSTTSIEAYESAISANLLASVAMCQAAVPDMVGAGWGRIIAITSISVKQPIDQLILSNTARSGLTAFLKTLSREVAPHGVTVNSVLPGPHATQRLLEIYGDDTSAGADIPTGQLGDPDDLAAAVAFLASAQARHITGVALPVDGGAYRGLM